jgi:hypothetical protein
LRPEEHHYPADIFSNSVFKNIVQERFMFQLNVQYMSGQCCGSGSVSGLHPDSMGYLDPDLCGQELATKKKVKKFHILNA